MVSTKKVCRYVIYTLLVETIPTRFYWLTCWKQKLEKYKALQQRLFVLILGFCQGIQVFAVHLMSILMIYKQTRGCIYQGNYPSLWLVLEKIPSEFKWIWKNSKEFKQIQEVEFHSIKGALLSHWHFFDYWKSFKNQERFFLFHLKSSSLLKIFKFLSWIFGHAKKRFG